MGGGAPISLQIAQPCPKPTALRGRRRHARPQGQEVGVEVRGWQRQLGRRLPVLRRRLLPRQPRDGLRGSPGER
eukprot:15467953-Alexandrium_andersonii.AAC.1